MKIVDIDVKMVYKNCICRSDPCDKLEKLNNVRILNDSFVREFCTRSPHVISPRDVAVVNRIERRIQFTKKR